MAIIINDWFGRLGNNILQVSSAVEKGIEKKSNIEFPHHIFFNSTSIKLYENDFISESGLYWNEYMPDEKRMEICQKYIFPILKKSDFELGEYDLVIHLRGGDVFYNPNNRYVQAPISYIKKVIDLEKPKKIYVVHEDSLNPNLEFLINNFDNVVCINNLQDGINYILSAKKLVITGIGTFARSLAMCSKNILKIYAPSFLKSYSEYLNEMVNWGIEAKYDYEDEFYHSDYFIDFNNIEVVKIKMKNYIKIGDWIWNEKNKEIFLNHSFD